jgi:hypothetical protein
MVGRITHLALDVYKERCYRGGLRDEVWEYGQIGNTPTAWDRVLRSHEPWNVG